LDEGPLFNNKKGCGDNITLNQHTTMMLDFGLELACTKVKATLASYTYNG
jgi:hypothetical protein